jgi:hypothetical protein
MLKKDPHENLALGFHFRARQSGLDANFFVSAHELYLVRTLHGILIIWGPSPFNIILRILQSYYCSNLSLKPDVLMQLI